MTIGLRLTRAFVLVAVLIATGAVVTWFEFNTVVRQTNEIAALDERLSTAGRLERDIISLERDLIDAADREEIHGLLQSIADTRRSVSRHLQEAESAFRESGAAAPVRLRASVASLEDEAEALDRLAERNDWMAIRLRARTQLEQVLDEVGAVIDGITAEVVNRRVDALREVQSRRSAAGRILAASAIGSLVASLLLGFHVTRSITSPLRSIKSAAHQLASSDFQLRLEMDSKDEFADVGRDLMAAARQLETSYNALTRSNQDLARFAAAVSHDLREPLRTVALFSELLRIEHTHEFNEQGSEYLGAINGAVVQMNRLIEGILEYSRSSSNEDSGVEHLSLEEIVRIVTSNLRVAIDETGAIIRYNTLPLIRANRAQMVQVFQNLIGNAIKYRRHEVTPQIDIQAYEGTEGWIISIKDNGLGIDPRYHERIFGVFQQLDHHSQGVGLGLAVAKRVVEQLGGSIWVESDGRNGSCFFLTIPAVNRQPASETVGMHSQVTMGDGPLRPTVDLHPEIAESSSSKKPLSSRNSAG